MVFMSFFLSLGMSKYGTVQLVDLMENVIVHVYHLTNGSDKFLVPKMNRFDGSPQTMESTTLPKMLGDLKEAGFDIAYIIKDGDVKVDKVKYTCDHIAALNFLHFIPPIRRLVPSIINYVCVIYMWFGHFTRN